MTVICTGGARALKLVAMALAENRCLYVLRSNPLGRTLLINTIKTRRTGYFDSRLRLKLEAIYCAKTSCGSQLIISPIWIV
jgi:hypothetical protein